MSSGRLSLIASVSNSDPNTELPGQRILRKRKSVPLQVIEDILLESEDDLVDSENDMDPDFVCNFGLDTSDTEEADAFNVSQGISTENSEVRTGTSQATKKTGKGVTRETVWFANKDNDLCNSPPTFTGMNAINVDGYTPLDYFHALVPESLLEHIVYQSNLYSTQCGKDNLKLSVPELKVFLGINYVMTYVKYARIRQYWSSQHGLRLPLIADHMTVNRFEEIRRFLHFNDNTAIPKDNTDKFIKIRFVLDKLQETFQNALEPEESQAIDEMMIPFKGRSSVKQYIKSKPKPWGFKAWVRAGISGYVYCFELYQGSSGNRACPSEFGVIGDVVLRLCRNLDGRNHKIYGDNLFTSIPLILKLKESQIFYLGTCRANRLQGAEKKLVDVKILQKAGRGSSCCATSADNVTVVRWIDNSAVHVASSFAGVAPVGTAKRWSKTTRTVIEVNRPYAVEVYNAHMGGVDLMDSLVALYRHTLRHKRWYMRIFHHFLNVVIVNAWILWRKNQMETMDLLDFKSSIACGLIFTGEAAITARKRGRKSSEVAIPLKKRPVLKACNELRTDGGNHYPRKSSKRNADRCHDSACRKKTRYICMRCNEPLCPECFYNFHTRR